MVMRSIVIVLTLLLASLSVAQESCVFLENGKNGAKARRPMGLIRKSQGLPQQQLPASLLGDYPNINISESFAADQNETSIAISPIDPKRILVGANDYRSFNTLWKFLSTDGGITWNAKELNPATNLVVATDPSVAFNTDGTAFYAYGRLDNAGIPYPRNDVALYRSTDGGDEFGNPFIVTSDTTQPNSAQKLADKYYLAVDRNPASPFKNRIYVAWAEYQSSLSSIKCSYSSDNGVTWSSPLDVAGQSKFQCPIPATAPNGDLFITYINLYGLDTNIYVARSTDGGKTIASRKVVGTYSNLGRPYPPGSSDPHPIIKGHLRVNSFPSIAIDNSAVHSGRIYIVWASKGADERHHIMLSMSSDTGNNWSVPKPIEEDFSPAYTDKFFPWVAVDNTSGDVGVVFYDSRKDAPANQLVDAYMAHSNDGGNTFAIARISDMPFNPSIAGSTDSLTGGDTLSFFGDYNGLAANDSTWYPVWTDSRSGYDQDIYTAIVLPYAPSAVKNLGVAEMIDHSASVAWQYDDVTPFGRPLDDFHFRVRRTDGGVDVVRDRFSHNFTDASVAPNTSYTYTVQVVTGSGDTSITKSVMFVPRSSIVSEPPVIISSTALSDGFSVTFRVPSKTEGGNDLSGLNKMYFYLDSELADSINLLQSMKGLEFEKSFTRTIGTFTLFEAICRVKSEAGKQYDSKRSVPVWLYAGEALQSYSESFQDSKNVFSPFAWDTTSYNGQLSSRYMNDSLPGVNYKDNISSWFALPPVSISDGTKTLEFDHIAIVGTTDTAFVEVSTDNGVHFSGIRSFNRTYHPSWMNSILTSSPVSEALPMSPYIGKGAITRFRLQTASSSDDGWYIKNIKYSDALKVEHKEISALRFSLHPNPVHEGRVCEVNFMLRNSGPVSLTLYNILGEEVEQLMDKRHVENGEYSYRFDVAEAGSYYLMLETPDGSAALKCIVLP
jgi:hypothetical protein